MPEGAKIGDAYVEVTAHISKNGQVALERQLKGTVSRAMAGANNRLGVNLGQGVARASDAFLKDIGKNLTAQMGQHGARAGNAFANNFNQGANRVGTNWKKVAGLMTKESARFFSDLGTRVGIASFQMQMFGADMIKAFTIPAAALAALFTKTGLSFAANVDKARAGLKAMLPAGYDVEALIKRLNKLAIDSAAFNADDVITYTQKLTAAGNPIKKTEQLMSALSNIFGTFGVSGENASLAMLGISQIFQKGKVQGEELTKQISQQIPIWKILAEGMGVTQAKLTEMVGKGEVSADEFQAAMVKIGNSKVYLKGALNAQNTLSGAWQKFKEALTVKIGTGFLDNKEAIINALTNFSEAITPLIDYLVTKLPTAIGYVEKWAVSFKNLMDQWERITPEQKDQILKIVAGLVAAGPALIALSKVGTLVSFGAQLAAIPLGLAALGPVAAAITIALGAIVLGFAAITAALTLFIIKTDEGKKLWEGFTQGFSEGWTKYVIPAVDRFKQAWEQLKPSLENLLVTLGFTSWADFGNWLGTTLAQSVATVIDKFTGFLNIMRELSTWIAIQVQMWKDVASAIDTVMEKVNELKSLTPAGWLYDKLFGDLPTTGKNNAPDFSALEQSKRPGGGSKGNSVLGQFAEKYGAGGTMNPGTTGGATGGGIVGAVTQVVTGIKTQMDGLLLYMNGTFMTQWTGFFNLLPLPMNLFRDAFGLIFGPGVGLQLQFQTFSTTLLSMIGQMVSQTTSQISRLLGILNGAITAVNMVLPKALKIPQIGGITGGNKGGDTGQGRTNFATGGKIGGKGSKTGDRVPIMGSRGEWVINAKAASQIGEAGMAMINSGKWPKFAAAHLAAGGSINAIIAAANTSGIGHVVGSTYRPGPPYHGTGQAVDFPGSRQDRFAQWWMQRGASLLELIHDSGSTRYGIKHGRNNPAAYAGLWGSGFMGGADNGHTQHVHVASSLGSAHEILSGSPVSGGGKMSGPGIGGGVNWMGMLAEKALRKALGGWAKALPGADGMGSTATRGIFAGAAEGMIDFILQSLPIDVASGGSGTGGAVGAEKWGGLVADVLKEMGLPLSHVGNILKSISQESGGNPNAVQHGYVDVNTATGDLAKGLNQVIGATFRSAVKGSPYEGSSQFDPRANIYASIRYAMNRYGSSWSEVMARPGGYDNGGFLPPGGLAMNTGRAHEMVLNPAQGKALAGKLAGGAGDVYVTAYIDGVEVLVRAEIAKNNMKIANAIERGKK